MANATEGPKLTGMSYSDLGVIGTGAGSQIRAIRDTKTGKRYALKIVPREGPEQDIYVEQAKHEFQVARMLHHPCLLKIHDCRVKRSWFRVAGVELLMEFVDGAVLDEIERLPVPKLVAVFRHVADALAHMHRRGVYHGDLKPGNIMLSKRGKVKVIDFGTAWIKGVDKARVQGTPQYMAPEQAQQRLVDARTDLYNFAATMYRMFTGEYVNLGMLGLENGALGRSRIASPASLNDDVPSALSELMMDCLKPNPKRRPSGLAEVRSRLDAIAEALGPEADEPPMLETVGH